MLDQWANLHGLPSRDLNSGLPYSKPAHYQLCHAARYVLSILCCGSLHVNVYGGWVGGGDGAGWNIISL
jgi:hypothetical protein